MILSPFLVLGTCSAVNVKFHLTPILAQISIQKCYFINQYNQFSADPSLLQLLSSRATAALV